MAAPITRTQFTVLVDDESLACLLAALNTGLVPIAGFTLIRTNKECSLLKFVAGNPGDAALDAGLVTQIEAIFKSLGIKDFQSATILEVVAGGGFGNVVAIQNQLWCRLQLRAAYISGVNNLFLEVSDIPLATQILTTPASFPPCPVICANQALTPCQIILKKKCC